MTPKIDAPRESTTLENCRIQQGCNALSIDNIGDRIVVLIEKLQGRNGGGGVGGECSESKSNGLLNDHKDALEYEARRLGEIQSDLCVLESLL